MPAVLDFPFFSLFISWEAFEGAYIFFIRNVIKLFISNTEFFKIKIL